MIRLGFWFDVSRTENSAVHTFISLVSDFRCVGVGDLGWGDFGASLGLVVSVECTLRIEYLLMVGGCLITVLGLNLIGDSFDQSVEYGWWGWYNYPN